MAVLPLVHLLMATGSLHNQGAHRLDVVRYGRSGRGRLSPPELVAAVPEVAQCARIELDEQDPMPNATPEDLRRLALHVEAQLRRAEVDGLVYVQGTNGIEETAYFLNLTVHSDKPVVVTGAQRPITAYGADGPMNLVNSVRVAGSPEARGKGVLVVTNDEINAAREVTKTHAYRLHTFRSRDLGVLGYADGDRVVFYRAPTRRHTTASEFDLAGVDSLPHVAVLYVHVGARPGLGRAAVALGAEGLVIAGTGPGALGALVEELAGLVREGIVVVRSARVGEGRVIRDDNWGEPGMVAADSLNPQKAALLLALALTRSRAPDQIQRLFDEY